MKQRIAENVPVLTQIPPGIKEWIGFASLFPATLMIMPQDSCAQIFEIRVGLQIIGGIEGP